MNDNDDGGRGVGGNGGQWRRPSDSVWITKRNWMEYNVYAVLWYSVLLEWRGHSNKSNTTPFFYVSFYTWTRDSPVFPPLCLYVLVWLYLHRIEQKVPKGLRKWCDEKRSALTLVFDVFTSFEKRHNKSASQVYRDRHQKVTSFGCTYTYVTL